MFPLPKPVFDESLEWLKHRERTNLIVLGEQLSQHLYTKQFIPYTAPCGCCDVVAIELSYVQQFGANVLNIEPVNRPKWMMIQ